MSSRVALRAQAGTAGSVIAHVWHLAVLVVIVASIIVQIVLLLTGGADANSGETGSSAPVATRLVRLFLFFTIDSNLIVALVCALTLAHPLRGGFWWEALRLNALTAITITGIVYATLIAPFLHLDGWALVTMAGLHVVSPIGYVLAWILFSPRRHLRSSHIPAAFVLPVIWLVITFVHGRLTGWYPYSFLDVGDIGLGSALVNALLILIAGTVIATLYRLLDAVLPQRGGRPRRNLAASDTAPE